MQSPYTRYVAAGIVLLASLSFLFPGGNGNIALADVQKAMEKIQTARVTGTRDCYFGDDQEPTYKLGVEKLFSLRYGYVDRTYTEDGRLIIEVTCHSPTGTMMVVFPTVKRYYRMQMSPEYREKAARVTPEAAFEWMFASGNYRKVGPREVQGIQAVGFEISDLDQRILESVGISRGLVDFFFRMGSSTTRLWVDPKARLPIQVEGEAEVKPCFVTAFRPMRLVEVDDRWEFNADLDEAQFNPGVPEGYESLSLPASVKAGAALSGIALAGAPVLFVVTRRSRRRRRE